MFVLLAILRQIFRDDEDDVLVIFRFYKHILTTQMRWVWGRRRRAEHLLGCVFFWGCGLEGGKDIGNASKCLAFRVVYWLLQWLFSEFELILAFTLI